MIYPGTDLKFRITATIPGFVIADHDFKVVVKNNRRRPLKEIPKRDCFADSEGQWYFTLENARSGPLFATFYAYIPDKDYNKQARTVTDSQLLCMVGLPGCDGGHHSHDSSCEDGHDVQYEQVWTVNLDDGTYLSDSSGNLILVDGRRVRFPQDDEGSRVVDLSMSGEEFKTLVEGRSDDSRINTVPEVMDVMQGLDEDTQLTVMTAADVDDMMSRVLATDSSASSD